MPQAAAQTPRPAEDAGQGQQRSRRRLHRTLQLQLQHAPGIIGSNRRGIAVQPVVTASLRNDVHGMAPAEGVRDIWKPFHSRPTQTTSCASLPPASFATASFRLASISPSPISLSSTSLASSPSHCPTPFCVVCPPTSGFAFPPAGPGHRHRGDSPSGQRCGPGHPSDRRPGSSQRSARCRLPPHRCGPVCPAARLDTSITISLGVIPIHWPASRRAVMNRSLAKLSHARPLPSAIRWRPFPWPEHLIEP